VLYTPKMRHFAPQMIFFLSLAMPLSVGGMHGSKQVHGNLKNVNNTYYN